MSSMLPSASSQVALAEVSVVLCTYNGARYLNEFLASLAAQSRPIDRLVLRDDGSQDDSVPIVRAWAQRAAVHLVEVTEPARRLGPALSFLTAIAAGGPAACHMLADQDDIWMTDKVERAVAALRTTPAMPTLYATRLLIVDQSLRPLGESPVPGTLGFQSAVYESVLTGCTMAFNEPLRTLVTRQLPQCVAMHDWWLYLLASATGSLQFDAEPSVLYRQHGQNAVGAERRDLSALVARLGRAWSGPRGVRSAQLREFERIHGNALSQSASSLVRLLCDERASWWQRVRIAFSVPIGRRRWIDRVGTRLTIIRNRF